MNRQKTWLLILLLPLTLSAGCSPKEQPLTFAVGGAPNEIDFWEEIVAEFEEESGIAVELLRQPTDSDQRRQGLVIPLQAKQEDPDLFLIDVVWLAMFAASGYLEPLPPAIEKSKGAEEVFFRPVIELVDRYRGKLVALPVYVDGGLLYYRRDLLEKHGFSAPPADWEEMVGQAKKIQEEERKSNPGFHGYLWQGAQYEGLVCNFLEFAASAGGGILGKNGGFVLDSPENRRALKLMIDLIHRHRISPPNTYTGMKEEEVREAFQAGGALFERNWPYAWALHQRADSPVAGKVGIAPLPAFPGGRPAAALGGWHLGISRFSDRKEEALQLVEFLASFEIQKKLAMELGWNPGRKDVYGDAEVLEKLPHLAMVGKILEGAVPRPVLPYYTGVSEVIQRQINAALSGRKTAREALRAAQQGADRIETRHGVRQ